MTMQTVDASMAKLAENIREYVSEQLVVWQTVPHWILEAEGRSGWYDFAFWGYRYGLSALTLKSGAVPVNFIECATAKIVRRTDRFTHNPTFAEADDSTVTEYYVNSPGQFNASDIVSGLMRQSTKNAYTNPRDVEQNNANREELRVRFSVQPITSKPRILITAQGEPVPVA